MQFSWKKSLLVICKTLGPFLNTLSADDKYSLLNRDKFLQHIQMHVSHKQKPFFNFFVHFRNLRSILNIFNKKMTPIDDVFLNARPPQNVVR